MYTSIFLTPVISQRLLGFTPTQTGLLLLPGSILAVLALIVTGKLLQGGVAPALIILVGFICFIFFNWSMSRINLETPAFDITLNLIARALGMALLTVPLGTLAVSTLANKDMPQGTALNNMMRQLGGSFGISIINTYVARRVMSHRTDLLTNITSYNPNATDRINSYTHLFQQKGFSLLDAQQKALALMERVVVKQSFFSSYLDAYVLIGAFFALALPLLLLVMKKNKGAIKVVLNDH